MGYLRRNLYNPNLIEIPNYVPGINVSGEEKKFVKSCREKKPGSFFDINDLSNDDLEILKSLSRFHAENPGNFCTMKELERIFIESIYDGNKKNGMQIYYYLRDHFNSLKCEFKDIEDEELVKYIVSMKDDFRKYVQSDFNQIVYRNGKEELERTVINKINPVDFYLNGMFINREDVKKVQTKRLKY